MGAAVLPPQSDDVAGAGRGAGVIGRPQSDAGFRSYRLMHYVTWPFLSSYNDAPL